MLQQLNRRRPLLRVAHEAPPQKVNPLRAELVRRRELRRVSLGDVVHDGPLVVEIGPGASPGRHLEDDAAEGPNVNGTKVARVLALDHLGRHVHGRSSHGLVGLRAGDVLHECSALASDQFGGAEIDVFDDAIVVEEDVCGVC